MTKTQEASVRSGSFARDIDAACKRIAPVWPLDRFLAVNPWWGYLDMPIESAFARLAVDQGAKTFMPRSYWAAQWDRGSLSREHIETAIAELRARVDADQVIAALHESNEPARRAPTLADVANDRRKPSEPQQWTEVILHQVSQHAAAWFDKAQSTWGFGRGHGLYGSWTLRMIQDLGVPHRTERGDYVAFLEELPDTPRACLEFVAERLGVEDSWRESWLGSLLASVRGWAAWCAYERWQKNLVGAEDDQIVHLLGIRAAWEFLLLRDLDLERSLDAWREAMSHARSAAGQLESEHAIDWILLRAGELAFAKPVASRIAESFGKPDTCPAPVVQAVFCIDVRSERYRRALESVGRGAVATRGFAGFFGLPIAWTPAATKAERPQLPGLLNPVLETVDRVAAPAEQRRIFARRSSALRARRDWDSFRSGASSAFTFVESYGLLYGMDLLRDALGLGGAERATDFGIAAKDRRLLQPELQREGAPMPIDAKVDLARGVLRAMGMTKAFPQILLLVGHGSSTANNAHMHGLDCGACGGQTGEVNAKALASLLQDESVRAGLRIHGIDIPATTVVLAGLHDTTTDEVHVFEHGALPEPVAPYATRLMEWLDDASARTRAERAESLGLGRLRLDPVRLRKAVERKAADWSETRPEWGLANNAALLIAPRSRSRGIDLDGRVFLHDYDWRTDEGLSTLTLLMTAPMVVAHWINMQYFASTVDNLRFGSGNKTLHNVVGGHIGVFEGNGGDLRTGLPMQSLHDGANWRHTPLRLSVFVEAPTKAIDSVVDAQATVRRLVELGWLHLMSIGDDGVVVRRRREGGWVEA